MDCTSFFFLVSSSGILFVQKMWYTNMRISTGISYTSEIFLDHGGLVCVTYPLNLQGSSLSSYLSEKFI